MEVALPLPKVRRKRRKPPGARFWIAFAWTAWTHGWTIDYLVTYVLGHGGTVWMLIGVGIQMGIAYFPEHPTSCTNPLNNLGCARVLLTEYRKWRDGDAD